MSRELAELARKAVDVIEQRGWCQNDYSQGESLCLLGAVNIASNNEYDRVFDEFGGLRTDIAQRLVSGLALRLGYWPAEWNDHPDRTEAEVKKALLQYADEIELQGEAE